MTFSSHKIISYHLMIFYQGLPSRVTTGGICSIPGQGTKILWAIGHGQQEKVYAINMTHRY